MDNKKKSSLLVTAGILALVVGAINIIGALISLALPSTYNAFASVIFINLMGALFDLVAAGLSIWFGIKLISLADASNKKGCENIHVYFQIAFWVAVSFGIVSVLSSDSMITMISLLYFIMAILLLRTQLIMASQNIITANNETVADPSTENSKEQKSSDVVGKETDKTDIGAVSDKIKELSKLREENVISEEVYLSLKKDLLKDITKKRATTRKKKTPGANKNVENK